MNDRLDPLDVLLDDVDEEAAAIAAVKRQWGQSATLTRSTLGCMPNEKGEHPYSFRALRFTDPVPGGRAQQGAEWEAYVDSPEKLREGYERRKATAESYGQAFDEAAPT